MADPVRGSSSPGSPGVTGAIKDAVKATVSYVADHWSPRSLKNQDANNNAAIDAQSGEDAKLGSMRQAQSTDRDNSYSY